MPLSVSPTSVILRTTLGADPQAPVVTYEMKPRIAQMGE